jgi:hypothetical protein
MLFILRPVNGNGTYTSVGQVFIHELWMGGRFSRAGFFSGLLLYNINSLVNLCKLDYQKSNRPLIKGNSATRFRMWP